MNDIKYVPMDVHSATITVEVQDERGRVLMQSVLRTEAGAIVDFIRGLRGRVIVIFEEGTHSKWLYQLLCRKVWQVVVCDPRANKNRGNKSDKTDAHQLPKLFRAGLLKPVYQGEGQRQGLKELARSYLCLVGDCTRVMNRIKAIFRSRAIACAGTKVYQARYRQQWLDHLGEGPAQIRAQVLYAQLDFLQPLRRAAKGALLRESRKQAAHRLLQQIPGLGDMGVTLILAYVMTPDRFRGKRQWWTYCGLSVVTRSSADHVIVGQRIVKRRVVMTRGLNRNHNHVLKYVFKVAASSASRRGFKDWYQAALAAGVRPENARLNLARKIAAITLAVWKKGEAYDKRLSKRVA